MESMPKDCFTFLGLCAVDRSNLECPAYSARPYSALSEIIAALGSRRTELLGWMVARQFKPFMVFMASHLIIILFSVLWPMMSQVFGLARVRRAVIMSLSIRSVS